MKVAPTLIAALVLASIGTALRLPASRRYGEVDTYEDAYYLPRVEWLQVMCLGHREAAADLLWMRTLVYYGDELIHQGSERHIFDYAEAVLALDPDYRSVYRQVGTLAIYRSSSATLEDVERAASIMERGVARFPDDGALVWSTGATLAFELVPMYRGRPDEQQRTRERAAPYLVRAAQLGSAPPYAMLMNSALLMRVGRAEEAITHLEEMYAVTTDLELRDQISERIAALRTDAFAAGFTEENARFEDAWSQQMPYAPAALYDLVGPVPPIDTTAILRDGFGRHVLDPEIALP